MQTTPTPKTLVEFDDEGEIPLVGIPNGEPQDKWINYLGLQARVKVNIIDWPNWRAMDASVKEAIWKEMKVAFGSS